MHRCGMISNDADGNALLEFGWVAPHGSWFRVARVTVVVRVFWRFWPARLGNVNFKLLHETLTS